LHTFNENIVGEIQVIREFRLPALAGSGAGDGNRKYRSGDDNRLKSLSCDLARALRAIIV